MKSLSVDICSFECKQRSQAKISNTHRTNLLKYRIQLNDLLDNPKATDKQVEDYIANLDNNYQKVIWKPKAIIFDLDWTLCELWDSANPYNHDGEELEIESMTHIYKHLHYLGWDIRVIMTWRKRKTFEKLQESGLWIIISFMIDW